MLAPTGPLLQCLSTALFGELLFKMNDTCRNENQFSMPGMTLQFLWIAQSEKLFICKYESSSSIHRTHIKVDKESPERHLNC